MESLVEAGTVLILIGFFIVFIGMFYEFFKGVKKSTTRENSEREEEEQERKSEFGGVIFIGPIPIVFGSSKRISKWMIVAAIIITAILVSLYIIPFII
ncbi:TIGR00304 family membrane protein [Sulfuracidifex tepidarius]|uniref:TIGR00304 family protein n=1 Tax=Sulfuracidifex tepidarius TaxID=1294262 RepID=A0A510DYQ7_9CREN|nr:TIGR00304 family protein [Sulfuracidifex tepidarius]BBG25373.1 hypothetical protein IC006_2708 [Sulfuracidifex tepidarius]BBG28167.1 hypothetical protein IC007_2722 [Sulfuracidifex tepidarius]